MRSRRRRENWSPVPAREYNARTDVENLPRSRQMPAPEDSDRPALTDPAATTGDEPAATADPTTRMTSVAARYALAEEIGQGGMGIVYRATDTAIGREVAVKVLREKHVPDSGAARRFADEA